MRAIVDLVAPDVCVACSAPADGELCAACADRIVVLRDGCPRCGGPLRSASAGGRDLACPCRELEAFDRARSLVVFAEPARSLTLALKRRARTSSVRAVGSLLARLARREGLRAGVVTYVPAGRSATRRGFDHAELIARSTAEALDVGCRKLLVRANEGPRQADVALHERRANVRGRFAARSTREAVLLVDDVYTTGSTAQACARALVDAGACSVDVLTWARTLRRRA